MDAALSASLPSRGLDLLLHHCLALDLVDEDRPSARSRLEEAVGRDMTQLLLFVLAPQGRRGSSSP